MGPNSVLLGGWEFGAFVESEGGLPFRSLLFDKIFR